MYKREPMFPKYILFPGALCAFSYLTPSMPLRGYTLIHLSYTRHTKHKIPNSNRPSKTLVQGNTLKRIDLQFKLRSDSKGFIPTTVQWRLVRYRFPHKLRKPNLALNSVIQLLPLKIVLAAPQVTDLYFVVQHSFLFDNISHI